MRTPTWDILICSIAHRTAMLDELLTELERQALPGVGILVCRDNLEIQYGDKCQRLLDASAADYVSWLDDDDWIARDFVKSIRKALRLTPDYVGFKVHYTEDGVYQVPVIHSLQYPGWHGGWGDNGNGLTRDIVHFNPIRRELAVQARWEGGAAADVRYADQLRALGCVRTEIFIDREIHYYRPTGGGFSIPAPMVEVPPRPEGPFPHVTWVAHA